MNKEVEITEKIVEKLKLNEISDEKILEELEKQIGDFSKEKILEAAKLSGQNLDEKDLIELNLNKDVIPLSESDVKILFDNFDMVDAKELKAGLDILPIKMEE